MRSNQQVGSWSLAAAGSTLLLAQLFHPILLFPVQAVGTATWLAFLLAGLLAIALYWPVATLVRRQAGGNLVRLAGVAAGTPGEIAMAVTLCSVVVFHGGAVLRETGEMAISAVYPHTPQTFAVVALTVCFLYGAWGGIPAIVRLCRMFLPSLLLALLLGIGGTIGWGEARFLLPLWGRGPDAIVSNTVRLLGSYIPVLFLLMAAGHLKDRHHLVRAGAVAIGGSTALMALTAAVFLMAFPLPLGSSVTFPLHEMTRLLLGGRFVERVDGLWMCIWVFGTSCHLAALLHMAAAAYAQAFRLTSHHAAVLPLATALLTLAYFAPDQGRTLFWHAASAPFAALVAFGLPLGFALVAWVRTRGATS